MKKEYITTAILILAALFIQGHYTISIPMYGYAVMAGVVCIAGCIWLYNNLIVKRNAIDNSFGAIDAILKKRYDLIPNLVTLVKKYMQHEHSTLTHITALRSQAIHSSDLQETDSLNTQISERIQTIICSVESYPELQSSANMQQLQHTLTEVENNLSAARRTYNQNVTNYNNACTQFPSNIIAALCGHKTQAVLDISDNQRENVNAQSVFQNK